MRKRPQRSRAGRQRTPVSRALSLGRSAGGWLTSPFRNIAEGIGNAIRTERRLLAEPIGTGMRFNSGPYQFALYAAAALLVMAWINNRQNFSLAVLIVLIVGAVYIVWASHRQIFLTVAMVIWWGMTGPFIALLAVDNLQFGEIGGAQWVTSIPLFWATGIAVWLAAFVLRARRPWLMLFNGWALTFLSMLATAWLWDPRQVYLVTWSVLALYLLWRSEWFLLLLDVVKRRTSLGLDYDQATEAQYAVYKEVNTLPRSYQVFRQIAVPLTENEGPLAEKEASSGRGVSLDLDCLVVSSRGVTYVAAVAAEGDVIVAAGRPRRILVNRRSIDRELEQIAQRARALRLTLGVEVHTIAVLHRGEFPNRGLLSVQVRPTLPQVALREKNPAEEVSGPESVTLLADSLVAKRLKFGPPVYTVGQLNRIVHRVRTRLRPVSYFSDEPKKGTVVKSEAVHAT